LLGLYFTIPGTCWGVHFTGCWQLLGLYFTIPGTCWGVYFTGMLAIAGPLFYYSLQLLGVSFH